MPEFESGGERIWYYPADEDAPPDPDPADIIDELRTRLGTANAVALCGWLAAAVLLGVLIVLYFA